MQNRNGKREHFELQRCLFQQKARDYWSMAVGDCKHDPRLFAPSTVRRLTIRHAPGTFASMPWTVPLQ